MTAQLGKGGENCCHQEEAESVEPARAATAKSGKKALIRLASLLALSSMWQLWLQPQTLLLLEPCKSLEGSGNIKTDTDRLELDMRLILWTGLCQTTGLYCL